MRQIKFRVWDRREKKMIYNTAHMTLGMIQGGNDDIWAVMQFTGLHDRNGKEIFEGDILEYYSGMVAKGENPMVRDVVRFVVQKGRTFSPEISGFTGLNGGEVIGNIYETPSLIQGETE